MHIPIARQEIASFLEAKASNIEKLWASGALKKSLHDDIRPIPSLARSSIFDVLEYAMSAGTLPVSVSRADSAMWVLYLCEISEGDEWDTWSVDDRAAELLAYAAWDRLISLDDPIAAKVAVTLIAAHTTLMNICCDNDAQKTIQRTTNLRLVKVN